MDEDKIFVSYPGNYHCAGNLFTELYKTNINEISLLGSPIDSSRPFKKKIYINVGIP